MLVRNRIDSVDNPTASLSAESVFVGCDVSLGHGTHGCPAHDASSRVSRNNHRCAPSQLWPWPAFGRARGTVATWPPADVWQQALVQHVAILESTLAVTKRPYTCRVASSGVSPPQSTPQRSRRRWHGPPSEDCSLNFLLLFASHESEGCKFKTSCCLFSTLLLLCTTGRQSQR